LHKSPNPGRKAREELLEERNKKLSGQDRRSGKLITNSGAKPWLRGNPGEDS
jgi:hypothetical protein